MKKFFLAILAAAIVATPLWAANLDNIQTKTITLIGKIGTLQRKG